MLSVFTGIGGDARISLFYFDIIKWWAMPTLLLRHDNNGYTADAIRFPVVIGAKFVRTFSDRFLSQLPRRLSRC